MANFIQKDSSLIPGLSRPELQNNRESEKEKDSRQMPRSAREYVK